MVQTKRSERPVGRAEKSRAERSDKDEMTSLANQHLVECVQTVFGEERARRLRRAFDEILNFGPERPALPGVAGRETGQKRVHRTKAVKTVKED
jgi:hypothetical protein